MKIAVAISGALLAAFGFAAYGCSSSNPAEAGDRLGGACHARDIRRVSGLAHGLSEAAIAAAVACQFSPGEKDGTHVAARIRGFKITSRKRADSTAH